MNLTKLSISQSSQYSTLISVPGACFDVTKSKQYTSFDYFVVLSRLQDWIFEDIIILFSGKTTMLASPEMKTSSRFWKGALFLAQGVYVGTVHTSRPLLLPLAINGRNMMLLALLGVSQNFNCYCLGHPPLVLLCVLQYGIRNERMTMNQGPGYKKISTNASCSWLKSPPQPDSRDNGVIKQKKTCNKISSFAIILPLPIPFRKPLRLTLRGRASMYLVFQDRDVAIKWLNR